MSQDDKPREWWYDEYDDSPPIRVKPGVNQTVPHGAILLIERAAYDKLAAELAECRQKNKTLNEANHKLVADTVELERQLSIAKRPSWSDEVVTKMQLAAAEKERDQARAECERLKGVLAAQGLPSDLQAIVVERDRYRAALERIVSGGGRAEVLGLELMRCPQCASAEIAREALGEK